MSALIGTVKWFNATKGFGFIAPAIENNGGYRTLEEGAKVQYEVQKSDRGLSAVNVKKI